MERWILFAIISMVFAGFTSVVAKLGMKDLSSDTALAVRTGIVFIIVTANAFVFRNAYQEIGHSAAKNIFFLVLSGLTTSLSWIFYYKAIKEGQVSYVVSIDKASIVVSLLLSFIVLKEPLTGKFLLGAGLMIIGMLILIWK